MNTKTLTIGVTLVGFACVGYYFAERSAPMAAVLDASIPTQMASVKVHKKTKVAHDTAPSNEIKQVLSAGPSQSPQQADWAQSQIEQDYVKAYQRYPHLRENAKYAGKALLSDAEMDDWRRSLEDETLIKETLQAIGDHYNPDYDLEASIVNQERIKFLKYSAQLANNPASAALFAGIEAFLMETDLDMSDFSDQLKRDVAGDKIELIYIYQAFKKGGRQQLDQLAKQSPKFAKLLKYARNNSQHLNRII